MTLSKEVSHPMLQVPKAQQQRVDNRLSQTNRTQANVGDMSRFLRPPKPAERKRMMDKRPGQRKEAQPFRALKMQKALSDISYGDRATVKSNIEKVGLFEDFSLLDSIQSSIGPQVLKGMSDLSPTPIQRLAIPALLGKESRAERKKRKQTGKDPMQQFLLAAETGSGKTLAYVLPVLDAIKRAESDGVFADPLDENQKNTKDSLSSKNSDAVLTDAPHSTTGRPRAVVLLPTSELVAQVASVFKALSHTVKFRAAFISAAFTAKVIRNRLFSPSGIDVLISTPHLLASIAESEPNVLSRVSHLVIDEADSLFDRSFAPSTSSIVDRSTPSLQQLILCSATIPRSLDSYLRERFPAIHRLTTPNLHAIPRRVQLGVVDIDKQPYVGNRSLACADTIWSIGKAAIEKRTSEHGASPITHIIVFVNEREMTETVADFLRAKGIDAAALNRDSSEQRQLKAIEEFTIIGNARPSGDEIPFQNQNTEESKGPRDRHSKRSLPHTKVLVSTDLGSRGIDTLPVRHVILYDVPHTTIDFIHRLGRTGRMGRRGRGIVLVGKHDRKDIVREIREGMFKGQALI